MRSVLGDIARFSGEICYQFLVYLCNFVLFYLLFTFHNLLM
jgi:hypothetical protein